MMLASHGYVIASLTFMDGTAPYTRDNKGQDKWIDIMPEEGEKNTETFEHDWKYVWSKEKIKQRMEEAKQLAEEIADPGFLKKHDLDEGELDLDKLFICGHQLGGWTAIGCSLFS